MGLSPGTHTMRLAKLKDLQTRKRRAIATTRKAKKKRLALKSKKYIQFSLVHNIKADYDN